MVARKPIDETRTLQVVTGGRGYGDKPDAFRVTIPSRCKVTYSPCNTMTKNGNAHDGMALRIYDGTSQIALFRDVQTFYDISLPIVRQKRQEKVEAKTDSKGAKRVEQVAVSWEDEDDLVFE